MLLVELPMLVIDDAVKHQLRSSEFYDETTTKHKKKCDVRIAK